jgi:tetratricopeptide (TPR) repeat protein
MNRMHISPFLTKIFSTVFFALFFINCAVSAQQEKPVNLKVFPKDIDGQELRRIMQSFTGALGVKCGYCHEESAPGKMDFASDRKKTKEVARVMLKMVDDINNINLANARKIDSDLNKVECITCHRGSHNIDLLEDLLFETYQKKGLDATLAKYGDLKKKYYGGFTYDFRDHSLLSLASKISASGKAGDALTVINKAVELFPESPAPLIFLADTYMKSGKNDLASQSLHKAIAIDPENRFANEMLNKLENPDKK